MILSYKCSAALTRRLPCRRIIEQISESFHKAYRMAAPGRHPVVPDREACSTRTPLAHEVGHAANFGRSHSPTCSHGFDQGEGRPLVRRK